MQYRIFVLKFSQRLKRIPTWTSILLIPNIPFFNSLTLLKHAVADPTFPLKLLKKTIENPPVPFDNFVFNSIKKKKKKKKH